ncbi:uncharacterized protein [Procambarus clarkii]|uniref:uncharacterized protein n=1 Tax=Procambarus clarkii TaxID=6728 RepID=UPI0037426D5D
MYYDEIVQNKFPNFKTVLMLHQWVHYCHVFTSGHYRVFVSGVELTQGPLEGQVMSLPLNSTLILGQDQDSLGGGFETDQVFRGHMTQVNIWNRSLSQQEVEDIAKCKQLGQGNIFSSDTDDVEVFGASVSQERLATLCQTTRDFVILPEDRNHIDSLLLCQRLGCDMYGPSSREENMELFNKSLLFKDKCSKSLILWVGLTDEGEEGVWRKISNNEIVKEVPFRDRQPNGYTTENCVYMNRDSGLLNDVRCSLDYMTCVPCTRNTTRTLRLRGLCLLREHETFFEMLGYINQKPYFHGYYGFMIYMVESKIWVLKNIITSENLATLTLPSVKSYPLGKHNWLISSEVCNTRVNTSILLSLSACDSSEYTCNNGECIPKEQRCNTIDECSDFSDEDGCTLVKLPQSYRSVRPPDNVNGGKVLELESLVQILRFLNINDVKRVIDLEINVLITWKDPRLKYLNLKNTTEINRLSSADENNIWRPVINFPNVHDGNIKMFTEQLFLKKTGLPLEVDFNDANMDISYSGKSASIIQRQHYSGSFACVFDVFYYPFDTQRCVLLLQLSSVSHEVVTFSAELAAVEYMEGRSLPSYTVTFCSVTVTHRGSNATRYPVLLVEFGLERRWTVIVLNVFLPTALLQAIGYATLFLHTNDQGDRLTLSLTTLLVLYTLFNNTSDALPVTAYVKMIDVWFFYCIFLLFSIILCHVKAHHQSENLGKVTQVTPSGTMKGVARPAFTVDILRTARVIIVPVSVVIFNVLYWSLLIFGSNSTSN